MDDYKAAATSGVGGFISCVLGCGLLAANITMFVYVCIFSFNNPDPENCWAADGLEGVYPTQALANTAITAANLGTTEKPVVAEDMHAKFVMYFQWTFYMCVGPLASGCVIGLVTPISQKLAGCLSGLVGLAYCGASLALFICGALWRFRQSGRAASGEYLTEAQLEAAFADRESNIYQLSSGKFIKILYLICMWSVIVSCACSCLTACLAAICGKR